MKISAVNDRFSDIDERMPMAGNENRAPGKGERRGVLTNCDQFEKEKENPNYRGKDKMVAGEVSCLVLECSNQ